MGDYNNMPTFTFYFSFRALFITAERVHIMIQTNRSVFAAQTSWS